MNESNPNWKLCVAPMLDWTDRHYRYLARTLSKKARLYTEMIHMGAIVYGKKEEFLKYDAVEHPLALQLGGSDPIQLAKATKIAKDYHFDEVNLNCGCPSIKVQKGAFGAALMLNANLVSECLKAMQDSADIEVTIKHRIGLDKIESYSFVRDFIGQIHTETQCRTFIVHARNAWLKGLSPKENRLIPPLNYDFVYRLKQDFPALNIVLNGGITNIEQIKSHLTHVDGVMIGREAYQHPMFLKVWDNCFYNNENVQSDELTDEQLIQIIYEYCHRQLQQNPAMTINSMVRHYLGLFHGQPHARVWRQILSNPDILKSNQAEIILKAYQAMKKA